MEDDCPYNKFSASASSSYKSDCLTSEKQDPESRFLCQIKSSSQSIDCSLAHCTVSVNCKSRNCAHPPSSNVLPTEDGFLDNEFSASASSSYKSDCLSTENASFKGTLELYNSSNVMHEKRKPFMLSGSLQRNLIHDESSFDSDEDIKFGKRKYRTKQNRLEYDYSVEFEIYLRSSPGGKEIYLRSSPGTELKARHCREKSALTKDILEEYDHRMDFFEQTAEITVSPLPSDSLLMTRFQHVNPDIAENGIGTSVEHERCITYTCGNMEHNFLVPAINNMR
uniref:Uncharacterized protein n=1 Tax=Solanum lycopersicum TaxID=4081 RepID=A0A3Q7F9A6_SOLLC